MKIALCIKQVPDLESLQFDPVTKTLKREGVLNLVNTFEKHALTAAKQIVEEAGEGEITVITMGPPQAKDALMELLASGAHRAVHLNDRAFAGSDTLATATALAAALRRGQYDLIFCGKYSLDAETGQVGPELAEMLDIPQVTAATRVALAGDGHLTVTRMTDEGTEDLDLPLPALVTASEDIGVPARPNKAGREAAPSKPFETLTAADLDLDAAQIGVKGSPTWVKEISAVHVSRDVRMLPNDDLVRAARELTAALVARGLFSVRREGMGDQERVPLSRPISSARAVWVAAELQHGKPRPVTLELLGEGLRLATRLKSELAAFVVGHGLEGIETELASYGADRIYLADDPRLARYDTELSAGILSDAIARLHPYIVLFPSSSNGRDLAPRVASRLKLGLTGDCIGFDLTENDELVQLKPAFGGNIVAPILSQTLPQMATVRPGVLRKAHPNPDHFGRLERLEVSRLSDSRVRFLSSSSTAGGKGIDLETARIVIGVGFGLGGPENLPVVEELARTLGASISGTRKIVDLDWLPRQQQVGLTGKAISPDIYFAVGIRGFYNHTVGIQKAGLIVAINKDPEAPIFEMANFGVVADSVPFLRFLTQEIKQARERLPGPSPAL